MMNESTKVRHEEREVEIPDHEKDMRKRCISIETQSLEAKLSREAAKIIKIKVAQDAANWELKEQVKELDSIRERQQQNLVDLQMQYETLDGEYQNELRLREDTLNKVSNTRSITNLLEEHYGLLAETLSRCQADRRTLYESYQKVVNVVRDAKSKLTEMEDKHKTTVENLEEKLKNEKSQKQELQKTWLDTKLCLENYIRDLKSQINEKDDQIKEINKSFLDLKSRFESLNCEFNNQRNSLDEKDKMIISLKDDMQKLGEIYNRDTSQLKTSIRDKDNNVSKLEIDVKSLKVALENQESFSRKLGEENISMQDKMSSLEEENSKLINQLNELSLKERDCANRCLYLQAQFEENTFKIQELAAHCTSQDQILEQTKTEWANTNEELANAKNKLNNKEKEIEHERKLWFEEKVNLEKTLNGLKLSLENKETAYHDSKLTMEECVNEITLLKERHNKLSVESKLKIEDLSKVIDQNNHDLMEKTTTITKLMSEIKMNSESHGKLESKIEKYQKEMETLKYFERSSIEKLHLMETTLKIKDEELTKQRRKYKDLSEEIMKLKQVLLEVEEQLEKANKELKEARKQSSKSESDKERNILSSPVILLSQKSKGKSEFAQPTPVLKRPNKVKFSQPEMRSKYTTLSQPDPDFDFLSDSSVEGYTIDPQEVNRRFAALSKGEKIDSPLRLQPTKRKTLAKQNYHNYKSMQQEKESKEISQPLANGTKSKKTFFHNKRSLKITSDKVKKFKESHD